ncbi:MAG: hypothetical protein AVDCRST_MAG53-2733 [uncultured Solirubrobacteraceae bacterium]|uniref:Uncharacterized protein n=1 Tax=uncultured Solirubrobacteraceae bacterium TaxID=1162706 RepID=A0A6J4T4C5_9ACTN|nr:MAG: hypothetical protein AVDCRST_MAG53-2733 [uncultured Solirubrobacteraceae bacterium]
MDAAASSRNASRNRPERSPKLVAGACSTTDAHSGANAPGPGHPDGLPRAG